MIVHTKKNTQPTTPDAESTPFQVISFQIISRNSPWVVILYGPGYIAVSASSLVGTLRAPPVLLRNILRVHFPQMLPQMVLAIEAILPSASAPTARAVEFLRRVGGEMGLLVAVEIVLALRLVFAVGVETEEDA